MATRTNLMIANLVLDGDIQPPMRLDGDTVETYMHAWIDGAEFPPVVVFREGSKYYLVDGFHRVRAAELAGIVDIPAEVYTGTKRDALLFAAGSNADHGKPRNASVKRWYLRKLMDDPEWGKLTRGELARICRVREALVEQVQTDLFQERKPREISPETRAKAVQIAEAGGQPEYVEQPDGTIDVKDSTPPPDVRLAGVIDRTRPGCVAVRAEREGVTFAARVEREGMDCDATQRVLLDAAREWATKHGYVIDWRRV